MKSPHVEKQAIGDLSESQLQALKETVKLAKANKNKAVQNGLASPIQNGCSPVTQPENVTPTALQMLNDHLGSEEGPKNKRLKRASEGECLEAGTRSDFIQDTASSHHEEETASLGKRSMADSAELRLCGKRKDLGHFLDSISMLEGVIAGLETTTFKPEKAHNELTSSADAKTAETVQDKLHSLFSLVERVEKLSL